MRILDQYVVRNFLVAALLWFTVFMSLRTVTDLFVNMDEFVETQRNQERTFGATVRQITSYYGHQSLVYFTELGGVMIVAAAAFTVARMNQTNELTAMLASGVSLQRVIWPIILCSILMGMLIVADQELVIPRVTDKLVRERDDTPGTASSFPVRLMTDRRGAVWYSSEVKPDRKSMKDPLVIVRDGASRQIGCAAGKVAVPGQFNGGNGWIFQDATVDWLGAKFAPTTQRLGTRTITPEAAAAAHPTDEGLRVDDVADGTVLRAGSFIPAGNGQPATLVAPRFSFTIEGEALGTLFADSAVWRVVNGEPGWTLTNGQLFVPTDLTIQDMRLRQSGRWLQYMSSGQLGDLIKLDRVPDRESAMLAKYIRITDPINNLIMLLLALPFILSRERNIKASTTFCLLMVGTFYAFIYLCRNMGLPPLPAAWLPVLLFGPVAVVMVDSVKT